jgi:hypothetical protein
MTFRGNLCGECLEHVSRCTCDPDLPRRPPLDPYGNCRNCEQPGFLCVCGMRAEETEEEESEE